MAIQQGAQRMPQDVEAERSVLSAMTVSMEVLQECLVDLEEEDFYLPRHRTIYGTMHEMFDSGRPVDPISLADKLKSDGTLDQVGGMAYLTELGADTFALASWRHYAEILRRDATLRRLILAAARVTQVAFSEPEDSKEAVQEAEKAILEVTDRDVKSRGDKVGDAVRSVMDKIREIQATGGEVTGVPTGIKGLDHMLCGLQPGQMVVIGARPGVGKTSLALELALNAAKAGTPVALFSLEMSSTEIAQRMLSAESGVGLQDIRSASIGKDDWGALSDATARMADLDIVVDDTPGTTVTEVRAKARRMLAHKEGGLVILDYLQLLSPPAGRRADSRTVEVSEMSRGIKIMAKDLGVPVVALSQLSRQSENRAGKRPQLSDLRESGSIEQDADVVVLLDRSVSKEEAGRDGRPDEGVTHLIVAKNRSGPVGTVELEFHAGSTSFSEAAPAPAAAPTSVDPSVASSSWYAVAGQGAVSGYRG